MKCLLLQANVGGVRPTEPLVSYKNNKDAKAIRGTTMPMAALKGPSAFIERAAEFEVPVDVGLPDVALELELVVEFEKTVRYRISQNALT